MTDPSPAAQAVLDAVLNESAPLSEQRQQRTDAAAVLRAAADQTIRPDPLMGVDCIIHAKDILAIAAELEADRG